MVIVINAISAKRGGALTYLENILPEIQKQLKDKSNHSIIVWMPTEVLSRGAWPHGIQYRGYKCATGSFGAVGGAIRRFYFDQIALPRIIRRDRADVLYSSANYGPLFSSCRQVLLVRNPVYFDPVFAGRMKNWRVKAYNLFQRWLTTQCIKSSDAVLFPTQAMLDLVSKSIGRQYPNWQVAHYGINRDLFKPKRELDKNSASRTNLLNVSLYSDQKNFGALLRAMKILEERRPRQFHLILTAGFNQDWLGQSSFFPNFRPEQELYKELSNQGVVSDIDWRSYEAVPQLYREADIFVFPSYTESFGHPLLEAMASGLPIVAADTAVNRELCGEAALYFPSFDERALSELIEKLASDKAFQENLAKKGLDRVIDFSWSRHVSILLDSFGIKN